MTLSSCRPAITGVLVGAALALCLFFERLGQASNGILSSVVRETLAVFRDPGTQWMVFLCAGIYFVTFTVLGKRGARNAECGAWSVLQTFNHRLFLSPDFWLCGLLLIAGLAYALDYERASTSTQALVLLAGAALGKGARVWANWGKAEGGKAESGNSLTTKHTNYTKEGSTENFQLTTFNIQPGARARLLLSTLLLLLGVAALWHPEGAMQFQYRGLNRWSGPWDNPNIFGMLMGVGVVLACGLAVSSCRLKVESFTRKRHLTPALSPDEAERESKSRRFSVSAIQLFLCLAALILCAIGLLKSYSRGAWLGAAAGLAAILFQVFKFQVSSPAGGEVGSRGARISRFIGWLGRNWRAWSVVLFSVFVIAFWQLRSTEFHPVRRAFSVGNVNDFSWRNRIAAWEGSLAMMADRPVTGFGWNQPEKIYDQFYRPPKVAEGMAIQLNHYFTLGMSLGLPALVCFAAYIGLALTRSAERGVWNGEVGTRSTERRVRNLEGPGHHQPPSLNHQLQAICRAGSVVLLIGLWFDGGLFNLATAAPLWVLLELGQAARVITCAPPSDQARNG